MLTLGAQVFKWGSTSGDTTGSLLVGIGRTNQFHRAKGPASTYYYPKPRSESSATNTNFGTVPVAEFPHNVLDPKPITSVTTS